MPKAIKARLKELDAELADTTEREFVVTIHMPKFAAVKPVLDYIADAIANYADVADRPYPSIKGVITIHQQRNKPTRK